MDAAFSSAMHSVASFWVSGCAAWWSMTMIGAFVVFTRSAHASSCWMVFVSRRKITSAFSICGVLVSFIGSFASMNFERWLGPSAAAISVLSCGRMRCNN